MTEPYAGLRGQELRVEPDPDNPKGVKIVVEDFDDMIGHSFCMTPTDARELAQMLIKVADEIERR